MGMYLVTLEGSFIFTLQGIFSQDRSPSGEKTWRVSLRLILFYLWCPEISVRGWSLNSCKTKLGRSAPCFRAPYYRVLPVACTNLRIKCFGLRQRLVNSTEFDSRRIIPREAASSIWILPIGSTKISSKLEDSEYFVSVSFAIPGQVDRSEAE